MASEEYREILETKRLEIVKSINCERSLLLNHLRSNLVFDQEDCELIRAATTNDARVGKLIDFLLKKGPDAYECFIDVVQIENPALYELLTGEKASGKPRMPDLAFLDLQPGNYSQLQPLVEYQQRMLQDLTDSAKRYREVLKANESLEKKLENASKDLEIEKAKRKHYENRLTQEMKIDQSLIKNEMLLCHEYDEMERGIADRDVYIIVLQMKLLSEKEEVEKLKTKIEELEHENEKMERELKRVSRSYNQERCQSLKLSECIRIQGDEIQKIDDLRKQLRECKFKNIMSTEERDAKVQELMELKKWAEALKTRFDVIEKEKQNSIEKTEVVSNNCVFLQETVRALNQKVSSTSLELEEMKKRNELLMKDCELFKTQRNHALEARREAVNSRDKVISEKESIQSQYNDLLGKREQMNNERQDLIQSYDSIHGRYENTSKELTRVKTALNEKELEVEDLQRQLREAMDKNHRNSVLLDNIPGLAPRCSDEDDDDDDDDDDDEVDDDEVDDDDDDDNNDNGTSGVAEPINEKRDEDEKSTDLRRPWRERRMKSLLNSIKCRISGDRSDEDSRPEPVSLIAGNVTLDVLQSLLPNLGTRPCSTVPLHTPRISRTLQRQRCLRQKKSECIVDKKRSQTAPCGMENLPDFFLFDDIPLDVVRSSSSTPDLISYPDDVNEVPPYFRSRSRNMTKLKNYRRTNSSH